MEASEPKVTEPSATVSLPSGPRVLSLILSVVRTPYGSVPQDLWGLSRLTDLKAPPGFVVDSNKSYNTYNRRLQQRPPPYPISSLRTADTFDRPSTIMAGIKHVKLGKAFNSPILLTEGIETLIFTGILNSFNHPLDNLPESLRELNLGGDFNYQVALSPNLKKLTLSLYFDHPLTLPDGLEEL